MSKTKLFKTFVIACFILAVLLPVAAAIPMVFNRDDSYLATGIILSFLFFAIGVFGIFRLRRAG